MATIVISSDSDCVLSDLDDDADAEFERDLKEAKRLSILESRAKIHDEETSEMIKVTTLCLRFYGKICLSA